LTNKKMIKINSKISIKKFASSNKKLKSEAYFKMYRNGWQVNGT